MKPSATLWVGKRLSIGIDLDVHIYQYINK
jgi:hypothetical protein